MFHFDPYVQTVKQLIESGRIGTLLHYYSRSATYTTLKNSITHHQAYTPCSILMDCIHDTDLLRWLTGRVPDYVFARGIQAGDMALNSFPNIVDAMYRYDGKDFSAHAHYNYVQSPQVRELEIVGGKGYIQGDFIEPAITVGTMDGNVKKLSLRGTLTMCIEQSGTASFALSARAPRRKILPNRLFCPRLSCRRKLILPLPGRKSLYAISHSAVASSIKLFFVSVL